MEAPPWAVGRYGLLSKSSPLVRILQDCHGLRRVLCAVRAVMLLLLLLLPPSAILAHGGLALGRDQVAAMAEGERADVALW